MLKTLTIVLLLFTFAAGTAWAGDGSEEPARLRVENDELRERVAILEAELEKVKEVLAGDSDEAADADGVTSAIEAIAARYPDVLLGVAKAPEKESFKIVPYGYIKLDAAYDTARVNVGNFARWVEPGEPVDDDNQFSMTANQTRLGLKVSGPITDDVKVSGKVEIDFYGGGENKAKPYMRHAYLQIDWPKTGWSFLAGQTWDVISPVNPYTINLVAWWSGNIGYRRPQIRVTKVFSMGEASQCSIALAILRTIGPKSEFATVDSGADSGLPTVQGRLAFKLPSSPRSRRPSACPATGAGRSTTPTAPARTRSWTPGR
jgi:hypothetical protein